MFGNDDSERTKQPVILAIFASQVNKKCKLNRAGLFDHTNHTPGFGLGNRGALLDLHHIPCACLKSVDMGGLLARTGNDFADRVLDSSFD